MAFRDFPCPFCRARNTERVARADGRWAVRCLACGASGPAADEPEVAARQWALSYQSAHLLRTVVDESPDIIQVKDGDGKFLLGNRALAALYGTTPEQLTGQDAAAFAADRDQVARELDELRRIVGDGETRIVRESRTDARTGETRHFHSIKKPLKGPDDEPRLLVIARDVTDIEHAHRQIEARERSYAYAMAAAGEGIWDWDVERDQVTHNAKWCELLGLPPEQLQHPVGEFVARLHEDDRAGVEAALQAALRGEAEYQHEHRMRRLDGRVIWVLDRGKVVERDADGRPLRMAGSFTDIGERKRHEQLLHASSAALAELNAQLEQLVAERTAELEKANAELRELALRDALTGLHNRLCGNQRLHDEFSRLGRTQDAYAVLMMDLDSFKKINDTYGHGVGDDVLRTVAGVLRGTVRQSDFVARFGGEEFMALLPATGRDGALTIADKIRRQVEATPAPRVGRVTISIGLAIAERAQGDLDVAVRQADAALYEAKRQGRNRIVAYPFVPSADRPGWWGS